MLNVSVSKFIWTFVVAYFFCSMLNWGIAEFLLNDWAAPYFEGFVRSGDGASASINIVKISQSKNFTFSNMFKNATRCN